MQTQSDADQFATTSTVLPMRWSKWQARWIAALIATLAMLAIWKIVSVTPYVDADAFHYRAMANGQVAMKPFAFRVLHIFVAWVNTVQFLDFHGAFGREFVVLLFCNLVAAWLLLRATATMQNGLPGRANE